MPHIPIEIIIVATAIRNKKKIVSSKEINDLQKTIKYQIEYDSNNELQYCTYNEEKDEYTVKDNIQIPPQLLQLLFV